MILEAEEINDANIKDINFWEQFTTKNGSTYSWTLLFRISKISTFESNSQPVPCKPTIKNGCSEYQRYQLLRAIHNKEASRHNCNGVVPNIKDINFWEQFTTSIGDAIVSGELFRISKISTFESNSQLLFLLFAPRRGCSEYQRYQLLRAIHNNFYVTSVLHIVVPNIKDINFWEQFTTKNAP